jgi:hypothetical protein
MNAAAITGDGAGTFWVTDTTNDKIFQLTPGTDYQDVDFQPSVNTNGENIIIGKNFSGRMAKIKWQPFNTTPTFLSRSLSAVSATVPDIINSNDITVVDGTWEPWGAFDTNTEDESDEAALDMESSFVLPTTSGYTNTGPYADNVPLPLPYGDLTENSDEAVWVCPLIDSVNHVYCVAGWPILSVANGNSVSVYVDGVLQSSGYTFDESNDYESQGNIAIIDFTADPGGLVTVKCKGKDDSGTLLTNPITIIEDLLDYAATKIENLGWQRHTGAFAQAKAYADTQSYTCAGVILTDQPLTYWIEAILKSFMGGFFFDQSGLLNVYLHPTTFVNDTFGELVESQAIKLTAKKRMKNIVNRLVINYARAATEIDRRYKQDTLNSYYKTSDASDATSIITYKGQRLLSLDFDWTRNTATVEKIRDAYLALYADARWLVTYLGQDFDFGPLDLNDQIKGTLSLIRNSSNLPINNVIFAIREKIMNFDTFTTRLTLSSIGVDESSLMVYIGINAIQIGSEHVYIMEE